jgi:hypothetical protein
LAVLIELFLINGDAGIEDRVETVAVRSSQVEGYQILNLCIPVDFVRVEGCFEIVQLVWIGFLGKNRRPVVIGESSLNFEVL